MRWTRSAADVKSRRSLRPGIQPKLESLLSLYEGKKIIVGRDKLDVVKGVVQKVRSYTVRGCQPREAQGG